MSRTSERIVIETPVGAGKPLREHMLQVAQDFASAYIDRPARQIVVWHAGDVTLGDGQIQVWWTASRSVVARFVVIP